MTIPLQQSSLRSSFGVVAALSLTLGCHTVARNGVSTSLMDPTRDLSTTPERSGEKVAAPIQQVVFDDGAFDLTPVQVRDTRFDVAVETPAEPSSSADTVEESLALFSLAKREPGTIAANNHPSFGTTLEEIEAVATTMHPAIRQARSSVEIARGQFIQAGLPFNPQLQYQSDEMGNDDSTGIHSVTLSQQYVTANKLGLAQQVQTQEIAKRQSQKRLTELRVLTSVRAAFTQALIAQRRVDVTEKLARLAEQSVEAVQSLLEAEEVSKIALLQAKVEFEQARIQQENAVVQLAANRRSLAAAAGVDALDDEPLVGQIDTPLDESPWDEILGQITAANPEMSASGSELERSRWALQLACAQIMPNVTGQIGVGVDTATDDTFARIGVSVPLPLVNRNQGNIRSARASVHAASAAIETTRLALSSRFADAIGRYRTAQQRYQNLTGRVIPLATETYELSQQAFDAGESDFLQLLTAQRTLFNTQLNVLEAARAAGLANADIKGLLVQAN